MQGRIGTIRQVLDQYRIAVVKDEWAGDRMNFGVSALGQSVQGTVDVHEDHVRIEVQLPWMLAAFAERVKTIVEKRAPLLLEQKPKKD